MRRASLVLSVMLIVAITVGYVARRSSIAQERDSRMATAAEVAASRTASLVDIVTVAARVGGEPLDAARSLAGLNPAYGVCAADGVTTGCGGDGPRPDDGDVAARRAGVGSELSAATVQVIDSVLAVSADGEALSVTLHAPADVFSDRADITVWIATLVPRDGAAGKYVVHDGVRQYATVVSGGSEVYVVATTDDSIKLPSQEARFYWTILILAIVLLILAGVTLVMEQRSLVERASFDPLTKLPNRSEFERRAEEAIADATREASGLSLLLFDLNGFKMINDTYGHHAGDEMLTVIGTRLRKAVRDDDVVARWGGDEFVVVMPGVVDADMAARRAEQLSEQVAGRTRIEGVPNSLRVKVSVGIAMWPRHGADLRTLVESADRAMYRAKREGETWQIADESLDQQAGITN